MTLLIKKERTQFEKTRGWAIQICTLLGAKTKKKRLSLMYLLMGLFLLRYYCLKPMRNTVD
jgi:hypothetical protein